MCESGTVRACGAWVWTRGLGGHVKRGRLIVFEGLDGCGKSTQLRRVAEALRERGLDPVVTREPTDGAWGRRIREMAQSGRAVAPETELAWFFEDRREHMRDVVRPALEAGRLVLSDRSYLSTVAYQGARGLDAAKILADSEAEFERPDCVLLFVIPAREGLARVAARGAWPSRSSRTSSSSSGSRRSSRGSICRGSCGSTGGGARMRSRRRCWRSCWGSSTAFTRRCHDAGMRITLQLDDDLFVDLQRWAEREGLTFSELVDLALRQSLASPDKSHRRFRQKTVALGLPSFDVSCANAADARLEDEEIARRVPGRG